MMTTQAPMAAVQAVLTQNLPDRFTVDLDTPAGDGGVTLTPITPPQPVDLTLRGGDKVTMLLQVTVHGRTRTDARLTGDLIRHVLTSKTRGRPTNPLTYPGVVFDPVQTTLDAHEDTRQGVHLWAETYRITWQPGTPEVS